MIDITYSFLLHGIGVVESSHTCRFGTHNSVQIRTDFVFSSFFHSVAGRANFLEQGFSFRSITHCKIDEQQILLWRENWEMSANFVFERARLKCQNTLNSRQKSTYRTIRVKRSLSDCGRYIFAQRKISTSQ